MTEAPDLKTIGQFLGHGERHIAYKCAPTSSGPIGSP
jgi:hypothetical protein